MAEGVTTCEKSLTRRQYRLVIAWAAGVLLLYAFGGCFGVRLLRGYAAETAKTRQARIDAVTSAPTTSPTAARLSPAHGGKPVEVEVALNVNRIGEVALKDSAWTADFNVSFHWRGDAADFGRDFRIVNGQVEDREEVASFARAGERYQEYRLVGRITKPFDPSRFPFGDEGLVVEIEDSSQGLEALRFVADQSNSGVNPDAMPRNVRLVRTLVGVTSRPHAAGRTAHSHFFFAMLVACDSVQMYLTLFQALFAAVAVAIIVLFIKPTYVDPRFGLPVGGFFAAVGNNIFVSSQLPASDRLSLADLTNATGLVTIFLVLVQSAVSLHILGTLGDERLSRSFDRVSFVVLLLGYGAVNLVLPLAANAL